MEFKYVFGPVNSSRLGLSLGLDLLGTPVCSFDCLYCEVGRTTNLTVRRKAYVPARDILDELARWRDQAARLPDYVTLGGSGEPCLNSEFPEVITGVRKIMPGIPVAVLTNSSLMSDPEVRRGLALADAVLPSMDTLDPERFKRLNRPHPSLDVADIARGMAEFREQFAGRLYLEILLVKGINDSEADLNLLKGWLATIRPDRVDVGSMTRPGAWEEARPVDADVLDRWRRELSPVDGKTFPSAPRRCAADTYFHADAEPGDLSGRILGSVSRRPQTADQLACALGADQDAVDAAIALLEKDGMVAAMPAGDLTFYAPPGRTAQ